MAAIFNDGAIPYGSIVLTIGAVTYIADNIDITRPVSVTERRNQLNEPSGAFGVGETPTGTATLQLAATSTTIPLPGATFNTAAAALGQGIGAEDWYITEVGTPISKEGERKVSISFRKKLNA